MPAPCYVAARFFLLHVEFILFPSLHLTLSWQWQEQITTIITTIMITIIPIIIITITIITIIITIITNVLCCLRFLHVRRALFLGLRFAVLEIRCPG